MRSEPHAPSITLVACTSSGLRSLLAALRFVHFIDKLYDQRVKLAVSANCELHDLFLPEYRDKGYRKKYQRCLSRLTELLKEWKRD